MVIFPYRPEYLKRFCGENILDIKEKFCPVCKYKNESNAVFCKHCGALLGNQPWDSAATTVNTDAMEKGAVKLPDSFIDEALIPQGGIAVYVAGAPNLIYLSFDENLVFGRKSENKFDETLLDLTALGGYQMGLSRQHAMIRRKETGFELVDLSSTNGSWLNDEKLVPYQPYPLKSGAQLRFGRMKLVIFYRPIPQKKKAG